MTAHKTRTRDVPGVAGTDTTPDGAVTASHRTVRDKSEDKTEDDTPMIVTITGERIPLYKYLESGR